MSVEQRGDGKDIGDARPPRLMAAAELARAMQRDRLASERDLAAAARDREAAARDDAMDHCDISNGQFDGALAATEIDPLTGARTRAAGLVDLDRELERCRRVGSSLVVAYVDVIGLKSVNDRVGHAAGDVLLRRVVAVMRAQLRCYDLIIRLGGDEFLCAISGMTLDEGRRRLSAVAGALAASPDGAAMRMGFAELHAQDDGVDELIARADRELLESRGG